MEDLLLHCSAPRSPVTFLERAADVYGDQVSIVYGTLCFSWRETHQRCLRLASALAQLENISRGDTVAALAPNIPALYELHFAVPMAGAVLSALNVRLDAATLAVILENLEAKFIFVDYQFVHVVHKALETLSQKKGKQPLLVLIQEYDQEAAPVADEFCPVGIKYNDLLGMGRTDFEIVKPKDEGDPISVNFTSGSTGEPKGVLYSHRAAYLNSLASILRYDMGVAPVFLWTVDMFRCNGWCCTWAMAALGGTSICLRNVSAKVIFDSILLHSVTHLCGAPAVLKMIADAPSREQRPLPCKVHVIIAGVLPMTQALKVEGLGFSVSYAYGMTEVLGPAIVRPWRAEPDSCLSNEHRKDKFHEALRRLLIEEIDVKDPDTMKSVPRNGKTIGEVMFRGNTLMSGYLKNPKATQEAFKEGWYRTRDLGLIHPNGVIQLKDRAMDIIVSGGEIVSTLEVEAVLLSHPKLLEAAVVGKHDDCLKEKPCAFVRLKEGYGASCEEIVKFCEEQLPNSMVPRTVVFGELPVNSTGKVQKFTLREKANSIHSVMSQPCIEP
ncbi:AMP-dependent synthetase/ligase domain - like 1 [Theobroma cacao]|nr:AMP-dependent synthetase/ligase domain - like 1 [Theobroma cacao]